MKGVVSSDVALRQMGAGRHVFAMEQVRERMAQVTLSVPAWQDAVLAQIDKALGAGREALSTEFSYSQVKEGVSQSRGQAVALDNELDVLISDMRALVVIRTRSAQPEVARAAKRIEQTLFRRGVAALTSLNFEGQLGVMEVMIEHFDGELRPDLEPVGLVADVQRFRDLVARFAEELGKEKAPRTTWDQVVACREVLHEEVCLAFIMIMKAFSDLGNEAGVQAREFILAPLREQQQRVLETQKRRRRVSDVDPQSGEELLGDASEAGQVNAEVPQPVG